MALRKRKWKKKIYSMKRVIGMFENHVVEEWKEIDLILIYATFQSIDQQISPSITNVSIHHLMLIVPIEIRLEKTKTNED